MSPSRRVTGSRPARDVDAVVRDVAVVDPNGSVRAGRWDVLIRDCRIDAIKRAGTVTARTRVTVDGSGCTVLPGLTDAHVQPAVSAR